MKTNTILIALLILCLSILFSLQFIEKFDNPVLADPLTYDDYIRFIHLAKKATEVDSEAIRIGLRDKSLATRIAPTPKDAIKQILEYVPNDRSKLDTINKQIKDTKGWFCDTNISKLQKNIDEVNKHKAGDPESEANRLKYIEVMQKQINILKSSDSAKLKFLCNTI